jgi:hypothetical protein
VSLLKKSLPDRSVLPKQAQNPQKQGSPQHPKWGAHKDTKEFFNKLARF